MSFSAVISSGPKVSGRWQPILMPVQPLSLWLAVTIATPFDLQRELGEIGHRREGEADVVHLAAACKQAGDQGLFD